jgi:hypothetical protein
MGTLNGHDWLRGCEESGPGKDCVRGKRLFCSNRGRRGGCGLTVSVMLGQNLRRFRVRSGPLWTLLRRLMGGASVSRAWEGLEKCFSLESAHRYRRALLRGQHRLRERMSRERSPPLGAAGELGVLLQHLESVLGVSDYLICNYQTRFQEEWPG